jgi:hypothetical protein
MTATTIPSHRELAASINPDADWLAGLLRDAHRDYDTLVGKLDGQAGWIIEKMQRLQTSGPSRGARSPLWRSVRAAPACAPPHRSPRRRRITPTRPTQEPKP